jgi:NTE family protein
VIAYILRWEDDLLLALSFSGGGMRAAAFSFGVMTELDRERVGSNRAKSLHDRVDFVSGARPMRTAHLTSFKIE